MKKLTFTLLFIAINVLLFGQDISKSNQNPVNNLGRAHINFSPEFNIMIYNSGADSVIYYKDTNKLEPIDKELFMYNENVIYVTSMDYNKESGTWEYTEKREYFMDNNSPEIIYDKWLKGYVNITDSTSYHFYPSIGDTASIFYQWDTIDNDWNNKYWFKNTISSKGLCTKTIGYEWDDTNSIWLKKLTTTQEILSNSPDTLSQIISYAGTTKTDEYIFIFELNEENQVIKYTNPFFSSFSSIDSVLYNSDGMIDSIFFQNFTYDFYNLLETREYDENKRLKRILYHSRETEDDEFVASFVKVFYNPEIPVSHLMENLKTKQFKLYPNPSKGFLNIDNYEGEILITNLTGQIIYQSYIHFNETIDLNNIPQGFYFITLNNGITKSFCKN